MPLRYLCLVAPLALILSFQLTLTGCAGGSSSITTVPMPSPTPGSPSPTPTPTPSPSPSPTPPPAPTPSPTPAPQAASRFVFGIIDFEATGGFFGGMINSFTGQASPVPGSPFANTLGENIVVQVITDPQGRFFYSLNFGANAEGGVLGQPGIGEYQINQSNGSLIPVPNGTVIFSSGNLAQMAIDGTGKFLYHPDGSSTDIYSINQSTGLLTLLGSSSVAVPVGTFSTASADGRFFFNAGNGSVEVFSINQTNGQLALVDAAVPTGGSDGPILVSQDSTLLFVANATQGTLAVFNIAPSGALTPVSGSPFAIDAQAEEMSLSPGNKFLYIAFGMPSQSHVKGYLLAAGSLTAIPGAVINNGTSINVDGSGRFAYVSQTQLVTYTIDPMTGALTAKMQTAEPWSDDPPDMVLTP